MFEKMKLGLARAIAAQLRCPNGSIGGRFVLRRFQRRSKILEEGAVDLLKIQPNDKVLEIGFGDAFGIRAAYEKVVDGNGMIYGVERSHYMLEKAKKFCALEIAECKVHLYLSLVTHLPFPDAFFDRIFHCNTHFYWDNLILAGAELKRVLKPNGLMVTTLSFDDLKSMHRRGLLHNANIDPVDYMTALETVGFDGVRVEYVDGNEENQSYQGIFAKKPIEDAITDDVLEMQEDQLRQSISAFYATEAMKRSGRNVASDYDPLSNKKSKSSSNSDSPSDSVLASSK